MALFSVYIVLQQTVDIGLYCKNAFVSPNVDQMKVLYCTYLEASINSFLFGPNTLVPDRNLVFYGCHQGSSTLMAYIQTAVSKDNTPAGKMYPNRLGNSNVTVIQMEKLHLYDFKSHCE